MRKQPDIGPVAVVVACAIAIAIAIVIFAGCDEQKRQDSVYTPTITGLHQKNVDPPPWKRLMHQQWVKPNTWAPAEAHQRSAKKTR